MGAKKLSCNKTDVDLLFVITVVHIFV